LGCCLAWKSAASTDGQWIVERERSNVIGDRSSRLDVYRRGMGLGETIDVAFDFRSDTPDWPDKDPDTHSRTLRRYHQLLWSKPLPSGAPFELDVTRPRTYL
jgi:hypothetical protein